MDTASIKSSSSNDISRISFQGKRALFEGVLKKKEALRTNSEPLVAINMLEEDTVDSNHDHSDWNTAVDERNKKLEQELFRLEQTAVLREEVSRRLREKIDKMEHQMEERDRAREMELARQEQERRQKENIIEYKDMGKRKIS